MSYQIRCGQNGILENYDYIFNIGLKTLTTSYKCMANVSTIKLYNIRRDFGSLELKEIKDIDLFMNYVLTTIDWLRIYGDDIQDETIVEKVHRYLSTNFDVVVVAIKESKDLTIWLLTNWSDHIYPMVRGQIEIKAPP